MEDKEDEVVDRKDRKDRKDRMEEHTHSHIHSAALDEENKDVPRNKDSEVGSCAEPETRQRLRGREKGMGKAGLEAGRMDG